MQKWLVPYFDYTLQKYTGVYWPLASVKYFVDSKMGNDTWVGSSSAPFKTLGKAYGLMGANDVIFVNGVFTETATLAKGRWVGVGGGMGGRAIFYGNIGANSCYVDNAIIYRNSGDTVGQAAGLYSSNCIFNSAYLASYQGTYSYYPYYCIFLNCYYYGSNGRASVYGIYGNNNTFYGGSVGLGTLNINMYGNNNHSYNTVIGVTITGYNNLNGISGNYLDPTNWNFNFLNTSPLYRTGTFNGDFNNYNHVGAGTEGLNKNGASTEMTVAGGATLTNEAITGTQIYRPNVAIDGTILSYYVDFGQVRTGVTIDVNNTYVQTAGTLNRFIQETASPVYRYGLDYILKYGNTTAEVDACPALLVEQGKIVTVSGTGASRVGNTDPTFDINNYTTPSFRYCTVMFRSKTV